MWEMGQSTGGMNIKARVVSKHFVDEIESTRVQLGCGKREW